MLIATAIGDAYGAAFEFTDAPEVPNDLSRYGLHPKDGGPALPAGSYTDDTMRAIANVEVMLAGAWDDPAAYAAAYLEARRRDRRPGWSKRFGAMMDEHAHASGRAFMRALDRRATNGCVMGVAPLGHLPDERSTRLAATMQTVATHAAAAAPYAQTIALAAHHLLRGAPSDEACRRAVEGAEWLDDGQRDRFRRMMQEPPRPAMPACTIAAGALWAVSAFDGMGSALRWCCSRGGDADSLAAVTMALCSAACDVEDDLPVHLVEGIEGPEERRRLRSLDAGLAAMRQGR